MKTVYSAGWPPMERNFIAVCQSACGRRAQMFTMMMTDIPLPMPRSVICSPSHITSIVADVIAITVRTSKPTPPQATRGFWRPKVVWECSRSLAMPKDWPAQSTSVR